jgi:hypothetical protein
VPRSTFTVPLLPFKAPSAPVSLVRAFPIEQDAFWGA